MIVVSIVLFIILSPGLLITIPPVGNKIFFSGKTSVTAILVHAVVFAIALYCILKMQEGFQTRRVGTVPAGGACVGPWDCAILNSICHSSARRPSGAPQSRVCVSPATNSLGIGYSCSNNTFCASGVCSNNICIEIAQESAPGRAQESAPVRARGRLCTEDTQCASGTCHAINNKPSQCT